jgi:hypothetical protein
MKNSNFRALVKVSKDLANEASFFLFLLTSIQTAFFDLDFLWQLGMEYA